MQTGLDVQKDPMAMQRIKEASEKAKIELSSSLQVRSARKRTRIPESKQLERGCVCGHLVQYS